MIEIARSNQLFELNLMKQKLEEHDIPAMIMDEHSGGMMHGIGGILPRLMVLDNDAEEARVILQNSKMLS